MTPDRARRLIVAHRVVGGLLAAPPDEDTLDRVRDPQMLSAWPLPARGRTATGLDALRESHRHHESAPDIAHDFQTLFLGPDRLPAPPWESVYRDPEHMLFGESTHQVRACYLRAGLMPCHLDREPDDHISLELEFLRVLLERFLATEDSSWLRLHDEFWNDHVTVWAPEFFDRVRRFAATQFMVAVSELGEGAVAAAENLP